MEEELRTYLLSVTTHESTDLYMLAMKAFEQLGYTDHIPDISIMLENREYYSNETVLEDLYSTFVIHIEEVFATIYIETNDELTLEIGTKLLSGLKGIEQYGFPEHLLNFINEEATPEESFADIISVIEIIDPIIILSKLKRVPEEFIERIKNLLEKKILDETNVIDNIESIQSRTKFFLETYNETLGYSLIKDGNKLGSKLETLVEKSNENLVLLENNPAMLALNILSIVLMSSVTTESIYKESILIAEDFSKDINVLTKVTLEIKKLLGES